ncbi:MAG: ABC transporter substrate-binding protein [Methanosarcinaceae archaeon]
MNTRMVGISIGLLLLCCTFPASASGEYTLGIFGNANEDITIDMEDVNYTEQIIMEYKDITQLADAKYDGTINILDVTQAEMIILGMEKELTYLDIFGKAEIVNKPIERLVNLGWNGIDMTRALGARDILVCACGDYRSKRPISYPVISKLPAVGSSDPTKCDLEMILNLKPDAVQTNLEANWASGEVGLEQKRLFKEKLPDIPLISLNMREPETLPENILAYGYIIDREDEALEFVDWFEGYFDLIESGTKELSEEELPRVYFEYRRYRTKGSGDRYSHWYMVGGGRNIADDMVGPDSPLYSSVIDVDPEWVAVQNPDYIFMHASSQLPATKRSYETDNTSTMAALREELMNRPELANVNAVKNGRVFVVDESLLGGAGQTIIGTAYAAKLMHPDLFTDIDPQAIHQEYVDRFCYIDFDVSDHGIFVYPELSWE